jgi:hypothetical protein
MTLKRTRQINPGIPALLAAPVLLMILGLFSPVRAQSSDVVALPLGGVGEAPVFELSGAGTSTPTVTPDAPWTLYAGDDAPLEVLDLRILPAGGYLLAGANGRGAAVTDAQGNPTAFMAPPGGLEQVTAASAAGFDQQGSLRRILAAQDESDRVAIWDIRLENYLWSHPVQAPAPPVDITQAIATPDYIVVGANWPGKNLSTIDFVPVDAPGTVALRIASNVNPDNPDNTIVLQPVKEVQDLFVTSEGRLLVSGPRGAQLIDYAPSEATATVVDSISVSDTPELSGIVTSARELPSGLIALATAERGEWIQPDPNHQISWVTSDLSEVVAQTGGQQRAPWRVAAVQGSQASGTSGFEPTLDYIPKAGFADISLTGAITWRPSPVRLNEPANVELSLSNEANLPFVASRIELRAVAGSCPFDSAEGTETLQTWDDRLIAAQTTLDLEGEFVLPGSTQTGEWCAQLAIRPEGASQAEPLGEGMPIRFVAASDDAGNTFPDGGIIDPIDLGPRTGGPGGFGQRDDGCGCNSVPPAGSLVLFVPVYLAMRLRRRVR